VRIMVIEPDPSFGGGSEAMSLAVAQGLAWRDHELLLVHEWQGSMLPVYDAFVTKRFQFSLPGFPRRRPHRAAECIIRIGRLAQSESINAIISSHLGFIEVAAWVSAMYGIPWCFHLGLPCGTSTDRIHLAYRMVAAGVAPSAHTAESWRRNGWPVERLHVIPNWVDSDRFRPPAHRSQIRRDLNLSPEAFYVLYVGRICREKGIEMLIEAFRLLAPDFADIYLLLVGPEENDFSAALNGILGGLDHGLRRKIVLRPKTDSPEKYFAAANLACIPPIWEEPFGLTLIEAMSCALPVVATDVGIFAQILGPEHAGSLVRRADSAGLASKLRWWLEHRKAGEEWGLRLRDRVLQNFTPTAGIEQYEKLLFDIVKSRRSPMFTAGLY
jgi:glycosyltransferase involved in cell wall biosynthesis